MSREPRKLPIPFGPAELERVRAAARNRGLALTQFVRLATLEWTTDTLSSPRAEVDPYARHRTPSFPAPSLRRG